MNFAAEAAARLEAGRAARNCPCKGLPRTVGVGALLGRVMAVLFPGCSGAAASHASGKEGLERAIAAIAASLERLAFGALAPQCGGKGPDDPPARRRRAAGIAREFVLGLPDLREILQQDAVAAYEGDPAAKSVAEVVLAYPGMYAITVHRIAHALYMLDVPLIPRMMSEIAHSKTGIDIHPGAKIGPRFFIDHGTGVVIGETCVIGRNVKLYQGVTLGALSFRKNEDGTLTKGVPRHPILGDNVTVYAGANILGRIRIGDGAVIGGNVWVTSDVPAGAKLVQGKAHRETVRMDDETM